MDIKPLDPRPSLFSWKHLMPFFAMTGVMILLLAAGGIFFFIRLFGAPQASAEEEIFVIVPIAEESETIARLAAGGYVKSAWGFRLAAKWRGIKLSPGGYQISKDRNAWKLASAFAEPPALMWITIPEGLRKEEIAEILAEKLGWPDEEREKWISVYTPIKYEYTEGVYFPDTYLIPKDEPPEEVAKRFQRHFEEVFQPYAKEALKQNIRWYTLLRIASIIQREAADAADMPLVAGILWNRLLKNMRLEVDATLQYARGKTPDGWWAPIRPEDRTIDSQYNTYKRSGLPPHPIANPGLEAIKAALFPEKTDCLYYLHDSDGMIHCAETFDEHKKNIEMYLR